MSNDHDDNSLLPPNPVLDSPPPSPPSPANSDIDTTKLSRKREREVSLEPAGTPKANNDTDPLAREARTPAKKNRRYNNLDSTAEEEGATRSRSRSASPGLDADADVDLGVSVSPPQEMKIRVRQISQGVEDLSWKNMQNKNKDAEDDADDNVDLTKSISAAEDVEIQVDAEPTDATVPQAATTRDSDSDKEEKGAGLGLKRKYLERGTSAEPSGATQDSGEAVSTSAEHLKRPRDDPDKDENPRETKRPSPPPEKKAPTPAPAAPAPTFGGGFMAYASTSSPFAAVKGANLFASTKTTPTTTTLSPFATASSTPVPSPFAAALPEPSSPLSTSSSTKRSVFGAASPFAASTKAKQDVLGSTSKFTRAKSPPRRHGAHASGSSAFSAYASGGAQGFALPLQRVGSPDGGSGASSRERTTTNGTPAGTDSGAEDERDDRPAATFGEKLRATKDEQDEDGKSDEENDKPVLTEQELTTGEENEETLYQVRGKLFALVEGSWKERGTGMLKLNVRRSDGGGARIIMRKEAVYAVLLNVTLFHGMRCALAQDPRYLRLSVLEGGAAAHYNIRVGTAKAAQDLMDEINANLPPAAA